MENHGENPFTKMQLVQIMGLKYWFEYSTMNGSIDG